MFLYKNALYQSKNNIIKINVNQYNNCCLCSLRSLCEMTLNYLLSPFFYVIISANTNTQKL